MIILNLIRSICKLWNPGQCLCTFGYAEISIYNGPNPQSNAYLTKQPPVCSNELTTLICISYFLIDFSLWRPETPSCWSVWDITKGYVPYLLWCHLTNNSIYFPSYQSFFKFFFVCSYAFLWAALLHSCPWCF